MLTFRRRHVNPLIKVAKRLDPKACEWLEEVIQVKAVAERVGQQEDVGDSP